MNGKNVNLGDVTFITDWRINIFGYIYPLYTKHRSRIKIKVKKKKNIRFLYIKPFIIRKSITINFKAVIDLLEGLSYKDFIFFNQTFLQFCKDGQAFFVLFNKSKLDVFHMHKIFTTHLFFLSKISLFFFFL